MPKKHKGSTKHSTTRIMVSLFLTILSLFIASCATSDDDDDPVAPSVKYGSLNVEFKTSDIEKILADREKIDVKVTILGDFSGTETKTIEKSKASEPVIFKFPEIKEGSVITVSSEVCETGFKTVIYDGKSANITIVKDTVNKAEINLAPCSSLPKIDLNFNTTIKSYSLVKILDVIYLSDKSNANYKDYSVCKDSVISDSVLQLKVKNFTESYTLKLNDKAITVTEGKVAFQDILTNTIASKNTIKILKGEETIDTAEYTVETGYYVCPVPALKIVTKEGSSEEVGKSHIIKAGENLRYGVKAGTSSKIEFEVVQEDGKAYPAEIKTSFKVENATVDNNLVTINGKNKNTYEVKVSIEVPEEYKKPGVAYSGTVSFTTKYDIETGYVKVEELGYRNYKLEYSNDGKSFETIAEEIKKSPIYCFDEYGDIYYTGNSIIGYSINKYSVNTKTSTNLDEVNFCRTLSYDYENSTLYCFNKSSIGYEMSIICGETNKNYSISAYEGKNISDIERIAVKDGNLYVWYKDTNTLYKYTMNISDTEIKLENEQRFAFPDNIKTISGGNVDVNDMVLLDDNIYMAVGMGKDYSKEGYDQYTGWAISSSEYVAESRGCILKFNLLNNKFDVTGLSENKRELSSGEFNLYGGKGFISCFSMSDIPNYDANKLYLDEGKTNPATFKIKITCYGPELEDSDLGYVHNFAAIKPKKLVFTQGKSFMYVDGEVSFDCKIINAYSSIDLSTFAIDGSLEKIDDMNFDFKFANCISVQVFDESTTLYYGENEPGQFQTFYFQKQ